MKSIPYVLAAGDQESIALQGVLGGFGGGAIELRCRSVTSDELLILRPTITAIQVSSIQ